ncbi:MAG: LysR family transcriptional regulator [Rhizobiales bacterium]|nr:LysR family transcriptional regulator [Hyphomicrobiales bacterium]
MDVRQLRYLIALVREQHFSRAAESCNISQPALSAQIRRLEEELGVPLIRRGNSYGGLTPEGERILAWAKRIVTQADALLDEASELRGELVGSIAIGVIPSALSVLPLLTAPLLAEHPGLRLVVSSLSSIEIQRGLDNLALDAGLTYLDNEPLQNVDMLGLYHEEFALLAPQAAVVDLPEVVAWRDLERLPLCLLTPDMQNRRIIDGIFARVGIAPAPIVQSNSVVTLLGHVRHAGLFSIVARNHLTLLGSLGGVVLKRLIRPQVRQRVGLVRHATEVPSPRIDALWRLGKRLDLDARLLEAMPS